MGRLREGWGGGRLASAGCRNASNACVADAHGHARALGGLGCLGGGGDCHGARARDDWVRGQKCMHTRMQAGSAEVTREGAGLGKRTRAPRKWANARHAPHAPSSAPG